MIILETIIRLPLAETQDEDIRPFQSIQALSIASPTQSPDSDPDRRLDPFTDQHLGLYPNR
jgi:hypothetical protein